jgi:hypothetical protein
MNCPPDQKGYLYGGWGTVVHEMVAKPSAISEVARELGSGMWHTLQNNDCCPLASPGVLLPFPTELMKTVV